MKIWLCKEFDYLWLQGSIRLYLWGIRIINSTSSEGEALGICKWDLDWSISRFLWQQCFNDNQSGHELPNSRHPCLALGTSSLLKAKSLSTSEKMFTFPVCKGFNNTRWHVLELYPRAPKQSDLIKNTPERKWWGWSYEVSVETDNDQNCPMET